MVWTAGLKPHYALSWPPFVEPGLSFFLCPEFIITSRCPVRHLTNVSDSAGTYVYNLGNLHDLDWNLQCGSKQWLPSCICRTVMTHRWDECSSTGVVEVCWLDQHKQAVIVTPVYRDRHQNKWLNIYFYSLGNVTASTVIVMTLHILNQELFRSYKLAMFTPDFSRLHMTPRGCQLTTVTHWLFPLQAGKPPM